MAAGTKGDRTRERLVAEAASIFNQKGYAGTCLKDVMAATGLTKGGIYGHFASKEELAGAAFRHAWETVKSSRLATSVEVSGAIPRLRAMAVRFATSKPKLRGGCPLMNVAVEADDGDPGLRRLAKGALAEWQASIAGVVAEGQRAGEVRAEVEPIRVANVMIATLEGALLISRLERTSDALNTAADHLETMFAGLRVKTIRRKQ